MHIKVSINIHAIHCGMMSASEEYELADVQL